MTEALELVSWVNGEMVDVPYRTPGRWGSTHVCRSLLSLSLPHDERVWLKVNVKLSSALRIYNL